VITTSRRGADSVAFVAVLAVAGVLQLTALGSAPVRVSTDEARVAVQAQSIAATGRDVLGNRLPLFFRITNPLRPDDPNVTWWQPTLFYLIAGVLRLTPLSPFAVRLPIALLAIVDVVLIFVVARQLFGTAWYGVLAALFLALTPAHFIFGRQAFDYFCPMTATLAWLVCLLRALDSDEAWWPAATGFLLGIALYSYITSWVVMPCYVGATAVALWWCGKPIRHVAALAIGFAIPLLPLAIWLMAHPSMPREVFADYRVKSTIHLADRLDVYWDYFNPSYLFFSGGSNPMFATRRAGVFPLGAAVLLPCGLWSIATTRPSVARTIVAAGFFFAPIPIVLAMPTDPKYFTARELLVIPYGVIISIAGVEWLIEHRRPAMTVAAVIIVASVPLQFAAFARDYFTRYQEWSAFRFDSMNFRDVAANVASQDLMARVPAVYVSDMLGEDKVIQCEFQLLVMGRADLWARTKYLAVAQADAVPPGSIVITSDAEHITGNRWEATRTADAVILRRN